MPLTTGIAARQLAGKVRNHWKRGNDGQRNKWQCGADRSPHRDFAELFIKVKNCTFIFWRYGKSQRRTYPAEPIA